MREVLRTSDELVDELLAADIIVAGVPMYNFGPPAQFKAWIDNIVRVGRTSTYGPPSARLAWTSARSQPLYAASCAAVSNSLGIL